MKKINSNLFFNSSILIAFLLLFQINAYSQKVIGAQNADASAVLELNSTTKGFLIPRMTEAQRDAIAAPAESLLVYCTDCANRAFYYYNSVAWVSITSTAGLEIESCAVAGNLVKDVPGITSTLTVTYKQSTINTAGTISFDESNIAFSGVAAPGLTVTNVAPATYTFVGINDTVDVAYSISGAPTTTGEAIITVDYASLQCTSSITVDPGDVTLDLSANIDIASFVTSIGLIDSGANTYSYNIPYSGGVGTNNITFTPVTAGSSTFSIASSTINDASGSITVTLTASPTYTVPESVTETSFLFALDVLVNGNIAGNITVNATGPPRTTVGTQTFMSHNLGADYSLDPSTPAEGLHGNYYQWGYPTPVANTSTADNTLPSGFQFTEASTTSWSDASNTVNDPCPTGFKVPSNANWATLISNTSPTSLGSFTSNNTNFTSSVQLGDLFFPTAGHRNRTSGHTIARGSEVDMWSSTREASDTAFVNHIFLNSTTQLNTYAFPLTAMTIRCIQE